jgi:hypothetical protein
MREEETLSEFFLLTDLISTRSTFSTKGKFKGTFTDVFLRMKSSKERKIHKDSNTTLSSRALQLIFFHEKEVQLSKAQTKIHFRLTVKLSLLETMCLLSMFND